MKTITKRFLYLFLTAVLCIVAVFCGQGNLSASADTIDDIQEAFEQTEVINDLKGATIGGKKFDLADYPHNSNGKPQLISFVEFCYSYYEDKQDDYGLYAYVYNPQDVAFDKSDRNKIQFAYGNSTKYSKFSLEFVSYSKTVGYEGRFYKFKVKLTDSERKSIFKAVGQNSRSYKISGIELCVKNVVTDYACGQTYTYSGYALGYGSELAETDTLSCTVDGFDTYVELDVNHTIYRAKGDYYNGEQSQLNSCYFRVPNKFFADYGELTEIACEWYEYFTKPILVTEDNYTYSKINALRGKNTDTLPNDTYFLFNVFWENSKTSWFKKSGVSDWTSNYGYEVGDSYHWGFLWLNGAEIIYDAFDSFAAAFYTGGSECEDYIIDSDVLKAKFVENSNYLGTPYIHGNYSKALFEDYTQDGRQLGYNRKEIKATDKFDIFWNYTTKSLWSKIFTGKQDVDTVYESLDAMVKVTDNDLKGNDSEIAERLKISEKDVTKLKSEQTKAKSKDETVVLFRYSSTKYFSAPAVSSYCSKSKIDGGKTLVKSNVEKWGDGKINAYVCQETVYLDFDIISLTYTKDGAKTVIPVVSSPQDVFSMLNPPLEDPADNSLSIFALIMGAVLLIVILILLLKFAPGVVTVIGKVLLFPFTCIGALFKAIGNSIKRRREKREEKRRELHEKEVRAEKKRRRRSEQRKQKNEPLPDNMWTSSSSPQLRHKPVEEMSRDEIESYLDSIDWTDPYLTGGGTK